VHDKMGIFFAMMQIAASTGIVKFYVTAIAETRSSILVNCSEVFRLLWCSVMLAMLTLSLAT